MAITVKHNGDIDFIGFESRIKKESPVTTEIKRMLRAKDREISSLKEEIVSLKETIEELENPIIDMSNLYDQLT